MRPRPSRQRLRRQRYLPLKARLLIVPAVQLSAKVAPWLFIAGVLLGADTVAWVGVILFGAQTLFTLITLPVEFDASARAQQLLVSHASSRWKGLRKCSGLLPGPTWQAQFRRWGHFFMSPTLSTRWSGAMGEASPVLCRVRLLALHCGTTTATACSRVSAIFWSTRASAFCSSACMTSLIDCGSMVQRRPHVKIL